MRLHITPQIQFRKDLHDQADQTEWFRALGDELSARRLTVTLGSFVVADGNSAVNLLQTFKNNPASASQLFGLPSGVSLEQYFTDAVEALDDVVKPSSDVTLSTIDLGPSSQFGKLLGLDVPEPYAGPNTEVGRAAVDKVFNVGGIEVSKTGAPADPLAGQLYMDATTFAGSAFTWPRSGVELEQVNGVSGASSDELVRALRSTNSNGRTAFQRLRKPELSDAYTIGYSGVGVDDLRWDADAHAQREKNKFVPLTVESGRYDANPEGVREVSLGTDKMDDTYYDTDKYALLDADYNVRGRARWDTDTQIRRLLIQAKNNTVIDDFGLKRNGKIDVRNDGASSEQIKNLDRDVRTGRSSWFNGGALEPLKGVYSALAATGKLPDIGSHQDVLMLEPKVHVRSIRSRLHLNETPLDAMQEFFRQTSGKLQPILDLAAKAKTSLTGTDLALVTELEEQGKALQDGTAILKLAEGQLKALDPAMNVTVDSVKALMPNGNVNWTSTTDGLSVEKKRVIAEAMDSAYHAFAQKLDDARRVLTGSQDRALEDYPELFQEWMKSTDSTLLNKKTYEPFLARYDQIAAKPQTERAASIKAFNDYGNAQKAAGVRKFRDFQPLDEAGFAALRPQLLNEQVRINQRQLEAAGSMSKALWFDEARSHYIPSAYRNTGNFIIDTLDMSEYVKHADWESIPEAERTPAQQLPADKIFHSSLVNETQIELGSEAPYLNRLEELEGIIKRDRTSLLMKYFDKVGFAGVDSTQPASYFEALSTLLKRPAAERDAEISKLNEFLKSQGSALQPLTEKDLSRLTAELFTADTRQLPVRTDGSTEKQLEGAKFIFQQIIDVQKAIVDARGKRVLDVLEGAGLNNLSWKQTDNSKGNTALGMLRSGQV